LFTLYCYAILDYYYYASIIIVCIFRQNNFFILKYYYFWSCKTSKLSNYEKAISFFLSFFLANSLYSQVLVEQNGTRIGSTDPLPPLLNQPPYPGYTPHVSQHPTATGNYFPIWLTGAVNVQPTGSASGIVIENYQNQIPLNSLQPPTWPNNDPLYDDPLIRGSWANTAWLGNNHFRFWQVHATEVWVMGALVTGSDM
jgi:hypothetical protein